MSDLDRPLATAIPESSTIAEVLQFRALHQGDRRGYTFLVDGEHEEIHLTYGQLDRKARIVAAHLRKLAETGDRALLLYPPGLDFLAGFFGCLYAGIVAVPAYPPRRNRPDPRVERIADDAQARVALTTEDVFGDIERRLVHTPGLSRLGWLVTDSLSDDFERECQLAKVSRDATAYLQYTSGSTSSPKGVMVGHDNIIENLRCARQALGLTSASVLVAWLPHFHDMGLVGCLLQPLFTEYPVVMMAPGAFVRKPIRWLQAISRYRATHSTSPNLGYDICVSKTTPEERRGLDLSCWVAALNGAEPIRRETLQRFANTYEPYGFRAGAWRPTYGLAEATLLVSIGRDSGNSERGCSPNMANRQDGLADTSPENSRSCGVVGCGQAAFQTNIRVVDPETCIEVASGVIGEIWASGPSVAKGYWQNPEETERTFRAYLADTGEGPFLRTGDLGFLDNNELFVTGRIKDLIIIAGANHYPQDIELTVETCHATLRTRGGAAFSVEVGGEECLVVVHEVEREYVRGLDVDEVIAAIRGAISREHELHPYAIVLLRPGRLPTTSSGKIARSACKSDFLEHRLEAIGGWTMPLVEQPENATSDASVSAEGKTGRTATPKPSLVEIRNWLATKMADKFSLDITSIDPTTSFADYGLDSLSAVDITESLQKWLGRSLHDSLLWDYPNIESLAQYLSGASQAVQPVPQAYLHDQPVSYRMFREADLPQLLRLWEEDGGWGVLTAEQWRSWCIDAPYGPALVPVALDSDGRVVGQTVFMPYQVVVDGSVHRAVQLSSIILKREFQNSSRNKHAVGKLIETGIAAALENGYSLVYALPHYAWLPALGETSMPGLPRFAQTLHGCVEIRVDAISPGTWDSANDLFVRPTTIFGPDFETLWRTAAATFPIVCGVVRESSCLRFKNSGHFVLEIRTPEDSALIGYTAIKKQSGLLVDILADSPRRLMTVLQATLDYLASHKVIAAENGLMVIKAMDTPVLRTALQATGFQPTEYRFVHVCATLSPSLHLDVVSPDRWYLTPGD